MYFVNILANSGVKVRVMTYAIEDFKISNMVTTVKQNVISTKVVNTIRYMHIYEHKKTICG